LACGFFAPVYNLLKRNGIGVAILTFCFYAGIVFVSMPEQYDFEPMMATTFIALSACAVYLSFRLPESTLLGWKRWKRGPLWSATTLAMFALVVSKAIAVQL